MFTMQTHKRGMDSSVALCSTGRYVCTCVYPGFRSGLDVKTKQSRVSVADGRRWRVQVRVRGETETHRSGNCNQRITPTLHLDAGATAIYSEERRRSSSHSGW